MKNVFLYDGKIFSRAGGIIQSMGHAFALAAHGQRPKIRVEHLLWRNDEPFVCGRNYRVIPLERDELVKSCGDLLGKDEHAELSDGVIAGLLQRISQMTGFEIPISGTDKPENLLLSGNAPSGSGFYFLNVAGFSERHGILIPKPRIGSALVESPSEGVRGSFQRAV